MQEAYKFIIAIGVLGLGFPLGILLARKTKEELKSGQKWFKLIVITSLIGAVIGAVLRKDFLLFSFLFIAVVTAMSLRK